MSNSPAESASTLLAERAWLQGAILCAGAYGIVFTLSLSCLHQLWSYRGGRVQRAILILYVGVVFLLCTLFVTSNTAFTQMAFINDRNFPGGPAAYEADEFSIPVDNISNVAYVIANWCTDAVLVGGNFDRRESTLTLDRFGGRLLSVRAGCTFRDGC